jgi:hypothetical protein
MVIHAETSILGIDFSTFIAAEFKSVELFINIFHSLLKSVQQLE